MLQQLLLGFAREAKGTILRVREARAAGSGCQLLEVGLLGRVAAGIHRRGDIPIEEKQDNSSGVAQTISLTFRPEEQLSSSLFSSGSEVAAARF